MQFDALHMQQMHNAADLHMHEVTKCICTLCDVLRGPGIQEGKHEQWINNRAPQNALEH